MSAPSWQDIYDVGRATAQARRPSLVINEGDVSDAFIAGVATMVDLAIGEASSEVKSTFLGGAVGDDLTALCHDKGVDRDEGDEAIGEVTIARATFAGGAGTYPAGSTVAAQVDANGAFPSYTTDVDAVFGPTDLTKTVAITCTKIGPEGNVPAGQITRLITKPTFDASFTVTNADLTAGGANAESDDDLRDRTRDFFLNQARATAAALIEGAKTVAGVKRATVQVDQGTGLVTIYVSDANGLSNPAMVAAVTAVMPDWASADTYYVVVGGALYIQAVDLSITVALGTNIPAIIDRIRASVISFMNRLVPGDGQGAGTLYRDGIKKAAMDVDRDKILKVNVNNPPADLQPASGQVIRSDTNHVTIS